MKKFILYLSAVIMIFLIFKAIQPNTIVLGTFTATKACGAYQSKNHKINIGNIVLAIGKSYDVKKINQNNHPEWVQIVINKAVPSQRWVSIGCGDLTLKNKHNDKQLHDDCDIAGLEDYYVFAISWQPTFCKNHPDKPECPIVDATSYQAKNFSLHGLWPDKKSCGENYGFCSKQKKININFCNYPSINLNKTTFDRLAIVMPSIKTGSCLQRHEWFKHGTCQTDWDNNQYFTLATKFTHQFNDTGISNLMVSNTGKTIKKEIFFNTIDNNLGKDAHKHMMFICQQDSLAEIYINLPKNITSSDTLATLIKKGNGPFAYKCPDEFKVDAIK